MKSMKPGSHPKVCIQESTYEHIDLDSLLKPLGGFNTFIENGDRILLKTNLLNATEPQKAVVTNPLVIREVATSVQEYGGIPYIGDSPSGTFSKRRLEKVYRTSGLKKISEELGIELNYDTGYKKISIPNGTILKNTKICNFILDADTIIAIPKIKTHSLMMMTLASKIMFGAIPGLTKAMYHSKYIRRTDFADMLLDVLTVTPPNLIIMDGIVGMMGDGPMSGIPVDLHVLLASTDSIALDLAVCRMLHIEPMGIPPLKQAKIRNMWPDALLFPLLKPEDIEYKDFILPSTASHLLTGEKKPRKHPVIKTNCVACGDCVNICPKKVITIKQKKAEINYSSCIQCYCCHEVCTYNAITLDVLDNR